MLQTRVVIVRATAKLRKALKASAGDVAVGGDDAWYANVVTIARQRWLLLLHEETLFPVVVPDVRAADLRVFGELVCIAIAERLVDCALPPATFGTLYPADVHVGSTASKRVLGHLTHVALEVGHSVSGSGGPEHVDLVGLTDFLARTPRRRGGSYVYGIDMASERAASGR